MRSEYDKAEAELRVFREFARKSSLCIDAESVEKRTGQCEPDIRCYLIGEGVVYFELVELCASDIASAITSAATSNNGVTAFWTTDPSVEIIRKKLGKKYKTEPPQSPVELLCYTNGRVITPDDVILESIRPLLLDAVDSPFRRVWLFGNDKLDVYKVWS